MTSSHCFLSSLGLVVVLGGCSSTQRPAIVDITPEAAVDNEQCQDESAPFVLDEDGDREVVPSPETGEVARGLEAYEAGAYEEAVVLFYSAFEGTSPAIESDGQLAQYFLAKALLHLGFFHSVLRVVDEIHMDRSEHPFLPRTVPLLAVLSQHLPNDAHVLAALQGPAREVPLPSSTNDEMSAYISFLRGKAAYQQSDYPQAIQHLTSVRSQYRWSVEARFYLAMIAVRQRRPFEALRVFEDMGHSSIRQERCGRPERRALRDLAALSIGRLLFSGAQTEDAFRAALRAYAGIGAESPHRSQATFERAWVHFQLGEDERSLVLIDSLPERFLRLTPEAATLRATIALARCDLDGADGLTSEFRRRWSPVVDQLRTLAGNESSLMSPSRQSLAGELAHRELESERIRRARDCLDELETERRRLSTMPLEFLRDFAGERTLVDVDMAQTIESRGLMEQVQQRYLRCVDEIEELLQEMVRLEAGVSDMRRGTTTCSQF